MKNQEIVLQMYQAFGTGDMPAFFALLDETIVWNSHYTSNIPLNGKFEKAEGIQTLLQTIGASVEINAFAPHTFLADGNKVVVLGNEEAEVKATSKTYKNDWVHVFTILNDKIVEIDTFNTTETVEKAFVD